MYLTHSNIKYFQHYIIKLCNPKVEKLHSVQPCNYQLISQLTFYYIFIHHIFIYHILLHISIHISILLVKPEYLLYYTTLQLSLKICYEIHRILCTLNLINMAFKLVPKELCNMDGWIDGWLGGWLDGWLGKWINGWTDRRMGEWIVVCLDGWVNGCLKMYLLQGQNATERIGINGKLFCLFLPISLHPVNFLPCQFVAILKWKKKKKDCVFQYFKILYIDQIMIIQDNYVHDYHW